MMKERRQQGCFRTFQQTEHVYGETELILSQAKYLNNIVEQDHRHIKQLQPLWAILEKCIQHQEH